MEPASPFLKSLRRSPREWMVLSRWRPRTMSADEATKTPGPEGGKTYGSREAGAGGPPGDVGGPADETTRPRARQNVWLEVGGFWGRLGRNKVMVIRKANIEIPSDLQGLEYYSYNDTPEEAGDRIRAFVSRLQQEI